MLRRNKVRVHCDRLYNRERVRINLPPFYRGERAIGYWNENLGAIELTIGVFGGGVKINKEGQARFAKPKWLPDMPWSESTDFLVSKRGEGSYLLLHPDYRSIYLEEEEEWFTD